MQKLRRLLILRLSAWSVLAWAFIGGLGCGTRPPAPDVAANAPPRNTAAPGSPDAKSASQAEPAIQTVQLTIDYGDGVQKRFSAIPWHGDMTVLDAMNRAKVGKHGIQFVFRGLGETALLSQIDDLENQGSGADTKNWIFYVNEHQADKSFGNWVLKPGDAILWKFEHYE